MQEAPITQKSLHLTDSANTEKQILMACLIYSAEYYPLVSDWLTQLTEKCIGGIHQQILLEAVEQLIDDVNREIVYGPSATFVAVGERPHCEHLDSGFIREEQEESTELIEKAKKVVREMDIGVKEEEVEELLWYRRSNYMKLDSFVNRKVNAEILKELEVNGQSWIKTTALPTLLLTLEKTLKSITSLQLPIPPKFNLLLARLSFLHNKILQNPCLQLSTLALTNYRLYIRNLHAQPQKDALASIALLLEYANVLVFYYKYGECQRVIEFCKTVANVDLEYTGRMGRRTKYQSFDTPQLVMNIREKGQVQGKKVEKDEEEIDKDAIEMPDAKELVLKQLQSASKSKGSQIDTAHFDQQNILLQTPKFTDPTPQSSTQTLPTPKILVTLSAIQYMWQTSPKEQMLFQYISTSLQTILQYKEQLSYPVLFGVLLLRSLNEFPRSKNIERAIDQLEKLRENFNGRAQKDMEYLYASSYMPFTQFIRILAQKYMEIGLTMSAIELYEKVGMIEECIDGLIAKNFKEKAIALAAKFEKDNGRTPRLLCMLGDLEDGDKCVPLYEEAWRKSQGRIARAKRSLGWHYFKKQEYQKAADAFKQATEANFYHPSTWFTLGCCYMHLKQFQKAVPAFGECVCIDETQGQAWGNIATCYIYQNRLKQAYSTLEQALKHSDKNWKLWSNMLTISLKLKKFYKYFECVERLVTDQKSELITSEVLSKIILIFQHQQQTSQRRRLIQAMKNRLDRLYRLLVEKIGQNPIVWHSIHEYNLQLQNFTKNNYRHYKKLHEQNKIDKNDLLDNYETPEQMTQYVTQTLHELKQNLLSSKQTELNMTMKIGWDSNKKQSEEVEAVLKQYVAVYEKYGDRKDEVAQSQFGLFVKGVKSKLEACLERTVDIKIGGQ